MGGHCDSKNGCVLDVLAIFGPLKAYDLAMECTCFPMNCEVASDQARDIVGRILGGATVDDIRAEVYKAVERAMSEASL